VRAEVVSDGGEDVRAQVEVGLRLDDVGRLVACEIHPLGADEPCHQDFESDGNDQGGSTPDELAVESESPDDLAVAGASPPIHVR
jgi:hypothetical protein